MRNTPLRAFAKKSPVRSTTSDVALGTAAATGGAAYGIFKGYGNLAKQKHGDQIIKDARMMPGKI